MHKLTVAIVVVLVGMASSSMVLAQGSGATGTQPKVSKIDRLSQKLNLTDPQKQQVQAILDKAKADAAAAPDPQAKREIHKAAWKDIRTNVLTEPQREQLAKMHRHHRAMEVLRKLNLTPEQKTQVKTIFQQARSDAANTTDLQAKKDVRKQAWQKVRAEVLTDAQRQQLDQMKAQWKAKHAPATSPS
jgi:Spy/CpxP family protein refolding chaperone